MKVKLCKPFSSQSKKVKVDSTNEEILLRVLVKGDTVLPSAIRFQLLSEQDV